MECRQCETPLEKGIHTCTRFGFVSTTTLTTSTFIEMATDAKRWRWLRQQEGWPETEMAALSQPPEWFDALADQGMDDDGK